MSEKIEIFKNYKCGYWRGIAWARPRCLNSTSLIGMVDVRRPARLAHDNLNWLTGVAIGISNLALMLD